MNYWIKNISGNIKAVFFKLGTKNVHHKQNQMTSMASLPRKLSWLQSLSVKSEISSFSIISSGIEGPAWSRHCSRIVLTLIIRLAGVDDHWLRWIENLGISVLIKTGRASKLWAWHFVSVVINISGAKFEEHCFNISRDILYTVFYHFSCKHYDVISFLICIMQNHQYFKNEN